MVVTQTGTIPDTVTEPTLSTLASRVAALGDGAVRYVSSGAGSSSGPGTLAQPYATIDQAINQSAAGDLILVMEGHAETISNATSFVPDVAGLRIVGLGFGSRRPTITFDNASGNVPLSGVDALLKNILFTVSGTTDVAIGITATGDGAVIEDCEMIDDCDLVGNFQGSANATGAIQSLTTLNVDIRVHGNRVENRDGTSEAGIVFVTTDTGFVYENFIAVPTGDFAQGIIADNAMRQYNNYVVDVAQERGAPQGTASA